MLARRAVKGEPAIIPAAKALQETTRVASVPGSAFFVSEAGKRMLRFCFAKDFDSLDEACKRLRAFKPATV